MFTPEFTSNAEVVLVSNHSISSKESILLSIAFNKARISNGREHLPSHIKSVRLVYDLRGQEVGPEIQEQLQSALGSACNLELKL